MKKLQKFLAAALLLAVVISAFGIFSAFAEDTETTTLVPTKRSIWIRKAQSKSRTRQLFRMTTTRPTTHRTTIPAPLLL